MVKAQLETPLAYEKDLDESFSSLTSSCSAAGYEIATPTPYALNSTAPPGPVPTCARTYTVAEDDTCESISRARSVSTDGIIGDPMDEVVLAPPDIHPEPVYLKSIGTVQPTEVPLPSLRPLAPGTDEDCYLYTTLNENRDPDLAKCEIIAMSLRITVDDLMKWNPSLSEESCLLQPGLQYCVAETEIGTYKSLEAKDKPTWPRLFLLLLA